MTVLLTHVSTTNDRCSVLRFSRLPRSPRISGCATRVYASRRNHNIFEVKDISPPPESLGLHSLPPNTTNGDEITVNGQSYIVETTTIRYKLYRGRYIRDHKRLDVLGTSRYLANLYLNDLLTKTR